MSEIRGNGETELGDRSIAELLKQLSDQTATLVRQELDLAKAELTVKGKRAGVGAGMLGGAGMFGLYALGALTACVILLLSTAMTGWLRRADRDRGLWRDRRRAGADRQEQGPGRDAAGARADGRQRQRGRQVDQGASKGRSGMSGNGESTQKTPEELREEIEQTREELGDTVEALAEKTDVKAQAKDRVDSLKDSAVHKKDEFVLARQGRPRPTRRARVRSRPCPRSSATRCPFTGIAVFAAGLLVGWLIGRR